MAISNFPNQNTALSEEKALVQVQESLLQTLITSVDGLRNEITQLRKNNAELKRVQPATDSVDGFPSFPKLALEIRTMIWQFAFRSPQTHIMGWDRISRSKTTDIMHACSEARRCGMVLKLPYYKIGEGRIRGRDGSEHSAYTFHASAPKHYINLDVDTIWTLETNMFLPHNVEFHGGLCDGQIFSLRQMYWGLRDNKDSRCPHQLQLNRLAISQDVFYAPHWGDAEDPFEDDGCVELLKDMRVQELVLVVGETAGLKDRNVRFVYPSRTPLELLENPGKPDYQIRARAVDSWGSWDIESQRLKLKLEQYKRGLAERKRL